MMVLLWKRGRPVAWLNINAWREVLARVFDGFLTEYDVSPDWLVNPETNRRLKLDLIYPEVHIAIRFQGLRGRDQRQRPSLEEEAQQKMRDTARADLCQAHGIRLVSIDAASAEPKVVLRELSMALSDASREITKSDRQGLEKSTLTERVRQARGRLDAIARRLRRVDDLKLYAELWEDRRYADVPQPESPEANGKIQTYRPGMAVRHTAFGDGVVQATQPDGADSLVTVRFAAGGEKTFVASLVSDKLIPQE
jgi:hypothetical protein